MTTTSEATGANGQWWPSMTPVNKVISAIGGKCEIEGGVVGFGESVKVGSDVVVEDGLIGANGADVRLNKWVGADLFASIWSSPDKSHWLTSRDPKTRQFNSIRVQSLEHAHQIAAQMKAKGYDVYYSTSEFFAEAQTRKAQDVACVRGFWLDIDVGPEKAELGQGYATVKEAKAAIKAFRIATGIPIPTHVVVSGSGLHVYWIVDESIDPQQWIAYAKLFKELTKALGLLADPTRTADIASLMRVPGTFNYKDPANPRPVELIFAREQLIEKEAMLNAILSGHSTHCLVSTPQIPTSIKMQTSHGSVSSILPKQRVTIPVNLHKLASALCVLSPDVSEQVWALHRIAPMTRAARENPDLAIALYTLARSWSSGELRGLPSKAWGTPGGNGLTGEQYFDILWKRFLTDNYDGGRSLGSIYFEARELGWSA